MKKNQLAIALHQLLANTVSLSLKTQNYHWNVTGPHFMSYHKLFEEQYTELAAATDEIAERIRALGERVPASLALFASMDELNKSDEHTHAQAMLSDLLMSHKHLITLIHKVQAMAAQDDVNDLVTDDLMMQRLAAHEKTCWMLLSASNER